MIIKGKSWSILFIIVGVIIALANAYLFLSRGMAWDGLMFLVGVGWIWLGTSNLRRLHKTDPQ